MSDLLRRRPLLVAAAASAVLGAGLFSVSALSQEGQPHDAQAAPAAQPPSPPPSGPVQEQPPSAGTEEAPPSADAPLAAPDDPAAAAEEDRLTAQVEAEASRAPAVAPTRRRARTAAVESEAPATGSSADQVAEAPPVLPRQRLAVAVIEGLDKTTARTLRFYAPVNTPVRYEGLVVTARACEQTNEEEIRQDNFAYLEIFSQPRASAGRPNTAPRQVYRGWMSAQAPTVHPFGHPAYDLWLIECRASAPVNAGGAQSNSPSTTSAAASRR